MAMRVAEIMTILILKPPLTTTMTKTHA